MKRSPNNLLKLSRSPKTGRLAIVNHFNRAVDDLAPSTNYPKIKALLSSNLWPWIWSYLKYCFRGKHPFPNYVNNAQTGVYRIQPAAGSTSIHIAVAGDWGTGTEEAFQIANLIVATHSDLTIHLGDVYFVGDDPEIEEKCLGQPTNGYDGVTWPVGSQGSFALNGNHEMYASGGPYFETFLPTLGMNRQGQPASYFCLETDQWRIIAVDTGYNSVGTPILSSIPLIKSIPFIGGDCHLEDDTIAWLRTVVNPVANPKPTLLLSHHQYFTAFPGEQEYKKPAAQLAEFLQGQEIVWIWGHEHRLGIYDKYKANEGFTFYGRCVGHSGMPVEMADPQPSVDAPLILYDLRTHNLDPETKVGQNGFVNATIDGPTLSLEYRDIDNILVLTETFTKGTNGQIIYNCVDPGILKRL
jgi:hypothetical protein